jgi:predicted SprT family Zn-dependent metalloprotease
MDPSAAERLAQHLMAQHGLHDWGFAFDRARRRLGVCDYRARRISLSLTLTTLNPEPVVRDTILHEIAHALTPGARHGSAWRAKAAAIGAQPRASVHAAEIATPPAPYALVCDTCHARIDRYRAPRRGRYLCRHCLQRHQRGHGPAPAPLRVERNPSA